MADPYLADGESVLLATDKVELGDVVLSALVLTDSRVLLIIADGDTLNAEEILLSRLRSAGADVRVPEKPALVFSYATESGSIRKETLVFPETGGKSRADECRQWAEKLGELIVPSLGEETDVKAPPQPVPGPAAEESGAAARTTPPATPAPPGGILAKHDRPSGLAFPQFPDLSDSDFTEKPAPAKGRRRIAAAVIALVIIAVLSVIFIVPVVMPAGSGGEGIPAQATTATPARTPTTPPVTVTTVPEASPAVTMPQPDATAMPPVTPAPTLQPTAAAAAEFPQIPVPATGVWVNVQYAGNFTGSVGVGGQVTTVSGTGNRFFQLATKTGTAKAIIQKSEGSGDLLIVSIYRDGMLIERRTTSIPHGEVNIQIELAEATPSPTASAPAVSETP